jgi:hypothetical protein
MSPPPPRVSLDDGFGGATAPDDCGLPSSQELLELLQSLEHLKSDSTAGSTPLALNLPLISGGCEAFSVANTNLTPVLCPRDTFYVDPDYIERTFSLVLTLKPIWSPPPATVDGPTVHSLIDAISGARDMPAMDAEAGDWGADWREGNPESRGFCYTCAGEHGPSSFKGTNCFQSWMED